MIKDKKATKGAKRSSKITPKTAKHFPRPSKKTIVKHDNQYEDIKKINADIPKHQKAHDAVHNLFMQLNNSTDMKPSQKPNIIDDMIPNCNEANPSFEENDIICDLECATKDAI